MTMDTKVESQPGAIPVRHVTITCPEAPLGAPAAGVVEVMPDELKELTWPHSPQSMSDFLTRKDGFTRRPCFVLTKNSRAYRVTFKTKLVCAKESEIELDGGVFALDWTPLTPDMKRLEERVLRQAERRTDKKLSGAEKESQWILVVLFITLTATMFAVQFQFHRRVSDQIAPMETSWPETQKSVERAVAELSAVRYQAEIQHGVTGRRLDNIQGRSSSEIDALRKSLDALRDLFETEKKLRRGVEQKLAYSCNFLIFLFVVLALLMLARHPSPPANEKKNNAEERRLSTPEAINSGAAAVATS